MKLSIIVPVYNCERFLRSCLDSCLTEIHNRSDYEIIAVNDGSTDNSEDIICEYTSKYSRIRYIKQCNQGLSAARNAGMSLASGDYFWFVDADDTIMPGALAEVLNILDSFSGDFLSISYKKNGIGDTCGDMPVVNNGRKLLLTGNFQHMAQLYIVRKQFLIDNDLHFKIGIYHEDSEYTPRMLFFSGECLITNLPAYNYYTNPDSITMTVNPKKSYDCVQVGKSLYEFSLKNEMTEDLKKVYCQLVSLELNNALYNLFNFSKQQRRDFIAYFAEHRMLFSALKKSCVKKYQLEYYLFSFFPGMSFVFYSLLRKCKFLFHLK